MTHAVNTLRLIACVALTMGATSLTAQHRTGPERTASGRVQRAVGDTAVAVGGTWVTLHRVGPDKAGPLDSVVTDSRGRFSFRYELSGSSQAIYFASATYAGIAYFTQPLTGESSEQGGLELVVFDTSSTSRPLSVAGRHIIVSAPSTSDTRMVIEVFEVSNDTSVTLVAGRGDSPTFVTEVPAAATAFQARESDIPKDAVTLRNGRVEIRAPIAPGLKQVAFSYQLPKRTTTMRFPVVRHTPVLEVLAEEPMAKVAGGALLEVDPVNIDGRGFRRFLSQDPPENSVVTVEFPAVPMEKRQWYVVVVLLGVGIAMLLALARAATRRR